MLGAPQREPRTGLPSLTRAWQRGELSNFDYLMELNLLAGRRLGDLTRYPLLPWVLDMTEPPQAGINNSKVSASIMRSVAEQMPTSSASLAVHADPPPGASQAVHRHPLAGWRDLSRSKWRLAKGDEQLDATFTNSAHHVSEALSELATFIYKARSLEVLLLLSAYMCAALHKVRELSRTSEICVWS